MEEMNDWRERTILMFGEEKAEKLASSHVLVAGLGGVGGYAAEAICRAGVGEITLVDHDKVQNSNRNRQVIALSGTLGRFKADVMAERLLDINPVLKCHVVKDFLKDEAITALLENKFDYIIDAIDTLSPKIFLIYHALQKGIPLVSAMGAGAKTDPTQIRIVDISKTYECKHAHMLRKKLHQMGIYTGFRAVFSPEPANPGCVKLTENEPNKKTITGTVSYYPAIFGMMAASAAVRDILGIDIK